MNLSDSEMMNKEYRHGLVNAQVEIDLPLQIRALRKQLVGDQIEMARLAGMKQPRISAMEKPGAVHFTLETLRRLAEAFDVALIVRFAPFSELLGWSKRFNPDKFVVPSFMEEVEAVRAKPRILEGAFKRIHSQMPGAALDATAAYRGTGSPFSRQSNLEAALANRPVSGATRRPPQMEAEVTPTGHTPESALGQSATDTRIVSKLVSFEGAKGQEAVGLR